MNSAADRGVIALGHTQRAGRVDERCSSHGVQAKDLARERMPRANGAQRETVRGGAPISKLARLSASTGARALE